MRISRLLAVSALIAFPAVAEDDEMARMQTGRWVTVIETRLEGDVFGEPISESETETTDECITEQDAVLLEQGMSDETCDMGALEQDSRSLRASSACSIEGLTMSGEALMRLSPDHDMVFGNIDMTSAEDLIDIHIMGQVWGRRMGECSS